MEMPPVFLVGMPGCGKTTIGKFVADILKRDFFDCDQLLELKHARTIAEIFAEFGEDYFRDLESSTLKSVTTLTNAVVATGGGIILRQPNRDFLARFPVVYLESNLTVLLKQTDANNNRPLLTERREDVLKQMLEVRHPLYEAVATVSFSTMYKTPLATAQKIASWLQAWETK